MSDRTLYEDNDGVEAHSMHPYQSVWMSHWTHTSSKSTTQVHNHSLIDYESKREDKKESNAEQHALLSWTDVATDISKKDERVREVSKATSVPFITESLTASRKRLRNESLKCEPFSMSNLSLKRESILPLKRDGGAISNGGVIMSQIDSNPGFRDLSFDGSRNHLPSKRAWVPPETQSIPKEYHHQTEGFLPSVDLPVLSHNLYEKNSVENSNSEIVPYGYGYDSGKTPMPSFMPRQREINQSNSNLLSREHAQNTNYQNYSSFLVHQDKTKTLLESQRSGMLMLRQHGVAPLSNDASPSSDNGPDFVDDHHQKLQCSGPIFYPEASKTKRFYHGSSSLSRMHSVHDVETMRIDTAIDSVGESSRGQPKFAQTTHHFLISKKTDVDLSDRGKLFRESTISTKFKRNAFEEVLSFSSDTGNKGQNGVTLQALETSTDSEGKENCRTSMCLKNESSAETDTMDIDVFQENHVSGFVSSPLHKCIKVDGKSQTSQLAVSSAREETKGKPLNKILLPDINKEPPQLSALASPVGERDTSTSRTQSLDAEFLLYHAEQHANSRSSGCHDGSLGPEPSCKWVKRLMSSASGSAHGTKTSKMGEIASAEKVCKIFSKTANGIKNGSYPENNRCHNEEEMVPAATTLRNGGTCFNMARETRDITLSHPWIQRWSHIQSASSHKKHEPVVSCEQQQPSKAVLEKLRKKQFPSIAAIALLGKSVSGLHPCEFIKKGSSVIWNTEAF
ncbi:F-box protein [Quillaja saponaria]|uniref:F-box protein n=1 Tax=Quillaja saponaria TaxID=32244 RepID=A0AAD7QBA7_QUISA|nr:F-box protein [Quillaja saponaria]